MKTYTEAASMLCDMDMPQTRDDLEKFDSISREIAESEVTHAAIDKLLLMVALGMATPQGTLETAIAFGVRCGIEMEKQSLEAFT